jgi:hypothetical protein
VLTDPSGQQMTCPIAASAEGTKLLVWYFNAGHWVPAVSLPAPITPVQLIGVGEGHPIPTSDMTGDGVPEFVQPIPHADGVDGALVSSEGGHWHYLSFDQPGSQPRTVQSALTAGVPVESVVNPCQPDCARGLQSPVIWRWDAAKQAFTTTVSTFDGGPWRSCSVPSGSTSTMLRVLAGPTDCQTGQQTLAAYEPVGSNTQQTAGGFTCSISPSSLTPNVSCWRGKQWVQFEDPSAPGG